MIFLSGSELGEVLEQTSGEERRLSNYTIDKYDYLFRCTRLLSLKELLSVLYLLDVCRTAHRVAKEKKFLLYTESGANNGFFG